MSDEENDPYVQVKVRMRKSVRDHLANAAEERNTSLNSEVISRLESTIVSEHSSGPDALDDMNEIMKRAFRQGLYSLKLDDKNHARGRSAEDLLADDAAYASATLRVFHNLLANGPMTQDRGQKEEEKIVRAITALQEWYAEKLIKRYGEDRGNE